MQQAYALACLATRLHTCFPHFQSGPRITCEPTTIEEAGCTGPADAAAAGCTGLDADAADAADADAAGCTGLAAEAGVACGGRGSGAAFSSRVADPAAARDGEMGMHDVTCCLASSTKALSRSMTGRLRARRATGKLGTSLSIPDASGPSSPTYGWFMTDFPNEFARSSAHELVT